MVKTYSCPANCLACQVGVKKVCEDWGSKQGKEYKRHLAVTLLTTTEGKLILIDLKLCDKR